MLPERQEAKRRAISVGVPSIILVFPSKGCALRLLKLASCAQCLCLCLWAGLALHPLLQYPNQRAGVGARSVTLGGSHGEEAGGIARDEAWADAHSAASAGSGTLGSS